MALIDLDAAMATIDAQVEDNLGPFRTAVELIMSIPGIKSLSAHVIVSGSGRKRASPQFLRQRTQWR
jgi:transposase